ncbi:prephenate dehydrogenase [Lactobacillus sp. CBA3606]|uniref:prephenate dehydrogenase n=1 Tax=Lactobacillus sp. CBA3606 TaxID=2099789 RepID=UPI000CFBE3C5|nr:prephenate dehydrogenase [Lactobacillus sp. CBA3606]AVK62791.1 prephenate dehydrogenase [Lactobacillus sp. CBA3606]
MTQVLINGLGLIGGSLALAIRQAHADVWLMGSDRQASCLMYAKQHRIIDEVVTDFATAAIKADVIILAGPVSVIRADLSLLATLALKPQVLVTDVGSTKQTIIAAAQPLQARGISFIGGHPMAGSQRTGVAAGRADLFENAFYFLVPGLTPPSAMTQLKKLLRATKVKWLPVTPLQHDRLVGQLSHLPHVVAATLVNQTHTALADSPMGLRLAAGGFKSLTRIASADPAMWTAILLNNTELVLRQLSQFSGALAQIEQAIQGQDAVAIEAFFTQAKVTRDQLGPEHLGQLPNFYDLFLNIPDHPGVLATIMQQLAQAKLNLINCHILEVREEIDGVLQLTFGTAKSQAQAAGLLKAAGYQIVRNR